MIYHLEGKAVQTDWRSDLCSDGLYRTRVEQQRLHLSGSDVAKCCGPRALRTADCAAAAYTGTDKFTITHSKLV
jgi:hypothetical protein